MNIYFFKGLINKYGDSFPRRLFNADMASLHWLDVFILGIFLLISIGIGVYHALTGGRQRTTAEFIMANRKL